MICTSIEQSKHLLKLGLDPKTADMFWMDTNGVKPCLKLMDDGIFNHRNYLVRFPNSSLPAWSLSALLEVMCYCHDVDVEFRKDKNLGWICKWTFYDFDNKKRHDLSKCGETKIEAAFEIIVTLFVQGRIMKGDNNESKD